MKKRELIEKLSKRTQYNKSVCESVVQALSVEIERALCDGEDLTLHGIGKWTVRDRKARNIRNPRTGASMEVPAKKAVVFKASSRINYSVNNYSDNVSDAMSKISV